jgi:hypothetical protein
MLVIHWFLTEKNLLIIKIFKQKHIFMINRLERLILGKMLSIKNGKMTKENSGIGVLLNKIKTLDEPLYDELLEKYKNIKVEENKEKNKSN